MKIVAKILLLNPKNEVLLLKRGATHPHFPGHLDFPGGEVALNEGPSETVAREVLEETGLTILPKAISLVFSKKHDNETRHLLYKGIIQDPNPKIGLSWEHADFLWEPYKMICKQALPPNVDPYYARVIKYLLEETGKL